MDIIETTAPISIENLKKYFSDKSISYIIDYENSSIKGKKLLTYLSNLDLPIDIIWKETDEYYELLQDYLEFQMILNVESLELKVIDLLLQHKNIIEVQNKDFIENNKKIFEIWESKIDSLTLFNMYIIEHDEFKQFVNSFPIDETESLEGVNFLSLIKHQELYETFQNVDQEKLKFYKNYFNNYMFKGKNLFHYWSNENNPLFLLTYGISENLFSNQDYINAKNKDIEEIKNVSSV
jgi:hypothetical protein